MRVPCILGNLELSPAAEKDLVECDFGSGIEEYGEYLRLGLLHGMRGSLVRGYLAKDDGRVVGYVAVAAGQMRSDVIPETGDMEINGGVPVALVSYLAAGKRFRRTGVGTDLLGPVFDIAAKVEGMIECRHVAPRPRQDEGVVNFYRKSDFVCYPDS